MTTQTLQVTADDRTIEIYLNDKDEIFFGEKGEENPYSSWMSFSKEDWEEIKKFVDKQFKLIE